MRVWICSACSSSACNIRTNQIKAFMRERPRESRRKRRAIDFSSRSMAWCARRLVDGLDRWFRPMINEKCLIWLEKRAREEKEALMIVITSLLRSHWCVYATDFLAQEEKKESQSWSERVAHRQDVFGGMSSWHCFVAWKSTYLDEWCNSSLWKVSLRSLSHLVSTTYEASVLREWIDRYWRTYKMDKCAMIIWNITPIGSKALMKNDVLRLWRAIFVHWIMKDNRVSLLDDVDVCLSLYSINHWINRQRRRRMWHIIRKETFSLSLSLPPPHSRSFDVDRNKIIFVNVKNETPLNDSQSTDGEWVQLSSMNEPTNPTQYHHVNRRATTFLMRISTLAMKLSLPVYSCSFFLVLKW